MMTKLLQKKYQKRLMTKSLLINFEFRRSAQSAETRRFVRSTKITLTVSFSTPAGGKSIRLCRVTRTSSTTAMGATQLVVAVGVMSQAVVVVGKLIFNHKKNIN